MMRRAVVACCLVVLVASCRPERTFSLMSDSTFVRAMIELRQLPLGTGNPSGRATSRDSILGKYGVTGADLESTAVWLAREPKRAADIWRAIESHVFTPP